MTTILFTLFRTPEPQRDMPRLAAAVVEAEQYWAIVDAATDGRDWLAADGLSLADIALAPYLHRWLNFPVERRERPALRRWHARLMGRPGFTRHVAVPLS